MYRNYYTIFTFDLNDLTDSAMYPEAYTTKEKAAEELRNLIYEDYCTYLSQSKLKLLDEYVVRELEDGLDEWEVYVDPNLADRAIAKCGILHRYVIYCVQVINSNIKEIGFPYEIWVSDLAESFGFKGKRINNVYLTEVIAGFFTSWDEYESEIIDVLKCMGFIPERLPFDVDSFVRNKHVSWKDKHGKVAELSFDFTDTQLICNASYDGIKSMDQILELSDYDGESTAAQKRKVISKDIGFHCSYCLQEVFPLENYKRKDD